MNRVMELDAFEIRARAERRIGQLMAEQRETVGLSTGARRVAGKPATVRDDRPALSEAGIDKNLAAAARKAADIPDEVFERRIATGATGSDLAQA